MSFYVIIEGDKVPVPPEIEAAGGTAVNVWIEEQKAAAEPADEEE